MTNTIEMFKHEASARTIHQQLSDLLQPELDKTSWIKFVELALQHLPQLDNSEGGRIPTAVIENSFVGKLGFSSWGEYLKEKPQKGGLGWTATGWKRYKQAYSLTKKYAWLRTSEYSVEQIRGIEREYKDSNFPLTLNEHLQIRADKAEAKERAKANALAERKALEDKVSSIPQLEKEISTLKSRVVSQAKLHEQIGKLENQVDEYSQKVSAYEAQIQSLQDNLKKHQEMGFLSHLKLAFRALR